ncbi:hypothetical protein AALP_AA8G144200 [Arabis alpina]|uniref:Uncharacterized protein n=1 Tax=Arabis alpina TaxID=50452 RepID=A0A087G717_ARAAL|nr:hypothetical protein AALP_AA8G144200 [Arabis alpina]
MLSLIHSVNDTNLFDRSSIEGSEQLEDSLGIAQSSRDYGSGKPLTLTSATTSAAPASVPAPAAPTTAPASAKRTTVPASAKPTIAPASAKPTTTPASESRTTSSAKKTTTTAKRSRLPSETRTELVVALPALLPSDYDAKRAAKGRATRATTARDRLIRMTSVFQDKASASSLFSTLVLSDDVVAPIDTKSSGEMMRHGQKFLALVNKVGHELETEVDDLKKQVEDEKRRTDNSRTAVNEL